jgi:hypothetical protein
VPLDVLLNKQFDKKELQVEAPYQVSQIGQSTENDDLVDNETLFTLTNARNIYMSFMDQFEKG